MSKQGEFQLPQEWLNDGQCAAVRMEIDSLGQLVIRPITHLRLVTPVEMGTMDAYVAGQA
ncbi:hypothetical protein [Heliophilum fasciatum]|uniref:hypothetical protein n=1 Tax=Heliophilum fasciatum TaxID=35700 RepID=UPI001050B415|nr:hypothetical protein [Heliophilum fasciatum]MCW2278831.1 hypothetical protein [Heliophilum fasciatum]